VTVEFRSFADFGALCESLAGRIASELVEAVTARGQASLVVPGGTTPAAFFDVLAKYEVPWDKVTITLTDERWVPLDSERSNERLVRARLLVGGAAQAPFVSLKTEAQHARDGEPLAEKRVGTMTRPFDVVLAGMGDDGHTASWIPDSDGLGEALDAARTNLVRTIVPPSRSNLDERLTLTLVAFLQSCRILVLVRGDAKRRVYERAGESRDALAMPIRALMFQGRVPVDFYWTAN
jgi:6-phosphogluconolactonase